MKKATFSLAGQSFMCIDSPAKHGFTFTPAMSLFVDCASEAEIDALFAKLSEGGQVMMPLGEYPFSGIWLDGRSIRRVVAAEFAVLKALWSEGVYRFA